MSEPKAPKETIDEVFEAFGIAMRGMRADLVARFEARDEQILQQERARVAIGLSLEPEEAATTEAMIGALRGKVDGESASMYAKGRQQERARVREVLDFALDGEPLPVKLRILWVKQELGMLEDTDD